MRSAGVDSALIALACRVRSRDQISSGRGVPAATDSSTVSWGGAAGRVPSSPGK